MSERVIYLLHLRTPYRHARHYTGSTDDLPRRLAEHRVGRGARLMTVVVAAGIEWELARVWKGDRAAERRLKEQGGASRHCPICKQEKRDAASRA